MKTFAELRSIYERTMVDANRSLRDTTKKYYREAIVSGFKAWPGLDALDVATPTKFDCIEWSSRLTCSASRFNAMVQQFRAMIRMAVELELRKDNPFDAVKPMAVKIKAPTLPTNEQFKKIIAYLENSPESRRAVKLIKFLAYSGRRIGEVRKMTREDITPQGIRARDTKNGQDIYGPILPEMAELIKTLPTEGALFRIKNPRKALHNACQSAGTAPLTNHQLRHLFATRCIECGVDIKTVAAWLGHSDGGALALKRYSHVRDDHSAQMAMKVSFIKPPVQMEREQSNHHDANIATRSTQTDPFMPVLIQPMQPDYISLEKIRLEYESKRKSDRELANLIASRMKG